MPVPAPGTVAAKEALHQAAAALTAAIMPKLTVVDPTLSSQATKDAIAMASTLHWNFYVWLAAAVANPAWADPSGLSVALPTPTVPTAPPA